MSFNVWMEKYTVVHPEQGLLSAKTKRNEVQSHRKTQRSRSGKGYILCDSNHTTFWKQQSDGDTKKKSVAATDPGGQGQGLTSRAQDIFFRVDTRYCTFVQTRRMQSVEGTLMSTLDLRWLRRADAGPAVVINVWLCCGHRRGRGWMGSGTGTHGNSLHFLLNFAVTPKLLWQTKHIHSLKIQKGTNNLEENIPW